MLLSSSRTWTKKSKKNASGHAYLPSYIWIFSSLNREVAFEVLSTIYFTNFFEKNIFTLKPYFFLLENRSKVLNDFWAPWKPKPKSSWRHRQARPNTSTNIRQSYGGFQDFQRWVKVYYMYFFSFTVFLLPQLSSGKSLLDPWCTTFLPDWWSPLIFLWFTSK